MIEFVDFTSLARRALLLAVVLAAGSCTLWAQYGGRGGGMRQHGGNMELQQLTQALSLTDVQQAQVKTLLEQRRAKIQALRSGGGQPDWDQVQAIRKDTNAKIMALLTDDQKVKLVDWLQQRGEQRRGRGGEGAPAQAPAPQPPSS